MLGHKKGSVNVATDNFNAIYDAFSMGVAPTYVAKYFDMLKSTVSNIIERITSRRSGAVLNRRGRKNKLQLQDLKRLEFIFLTKLLLPQHQIAAVFNANGIVTISAKRIRR